MNVQSLIEEIQAAAKEAEKEEVYENLDTACLKWLKYYASENQGYASERLLDVVADLLNIQTQPI